MLELLLGPNLDRGTPWKWRVPADGARAGWAAAGPRAFATRLATLLGLPHRLAHPGERTAAWAARAAGLDDGARSYSASREHDAWGVGTHLLGLRDSLRWAGWDGGPIGGSARLRDLADLEAFEGDPIPPGAPDLYHAILTRLEATDRLPSLPAVELAAPRDHFPPVVRRVLERLWDLGAPVADPAADAPAAPAPTDLGRMQRALLGLDGGGRPRGDGTVVVLEGETPWETAELTAAWWREHGGRAATWVAAGENGVLDEACRRHGIAAPGADAASRWRPALQVLPLRLALAFHPRDPLRAVELLSLPCAPLGGRVRSRLLGALAEMPGIGSPEWEAAVERSVEDAGPEGEELRRKIEGWFGEPVHDPEPGIPPADVVRLCGWVERWARARARAADPADPLLLEAAEVARRLDRMVRRLPDRPIPRLQLEELHDAALGSGGTLREPGEAGRAAVCARPGAVVPPVDSVVWWGWLGVPDPHPPPWTPPERRALSDTDVELEPPGGSREVAAWGWRRAVLAAGERLVLARWRLSGIEPTLPHPLEDELSVTLGERWAELCRVTPESALAAGGGEGRRRSAGRADLTGPADRRGPASWSAPAEPIAPAPLVRPRGLWRLPAHALTPPTRLSPTAIGELLECPLRWTLDRVAHLRRSALLEIKDGNRLVGELGHRLLAELLLGPAADPAALSPKAAARWCRDRFDARVEAEAAPLLRPGREVERRWARETIAGAASRLVELLGRGGWRAAEAEESLAGEFAGQPYRGRLDLLLEGHDGPGVLDLKLGRSRNRRQELREGRALQLALYARAAAGARTRSDVGDAAGLPPVGYFALEDARLLTVEDGPFPGAEVVDGPGMEETLRMAERAWDWWRRVMGQGLVPARHEAFTVWQLDCAEAAGAPVPEDGPAAAAAPCRWCDYQLLCTAEVGHDPEGPDPRGHPGDGEGREEEGGA